MLGDDKGRAELQTKLLLVGCILFAYAPTFGAGFLNYDDPWLIESKVFAPAAWHTPWRALVDFSTPTRLALGAEYLPVRDLVVWLETRVFGISAPPMHAISVLLFAVACLFLRSALCVILHERTFASLAALLFALHPIHVESVAWLSGQKDVLSMFFIAAALTVHARGEANARTWVPVLTLLACFSKAMSVSVIGLLLGQDFMLRRRPDTVLYVLTSGIVALAIGTHVYVGSLVGMTSEPAGGTVFTAVMTMGKVILRYLHNAFVPTRLSIVYTIATEAGWSTEGALGWGVVLVALLASLFVFIRYGQRIWLFAFGWFFVPLVPVAQIGAALQNRMADRYAYLSVLSPCLLYAGGLLTGIRSTSSGIARVSARAAALVLVAGFAVLSFSRSVLFTDAVLLFTDAALLDPGDPKAAYHTGRSLDEAGRDREAMIWFREAMRRDRYGVTREQRRAANALASILARQGAIDEAERVLRRALQSFPNDPTIESNLRKLRPGPDKGPEDR